MNMQREQRSGLLSQRFYLWLAVLVAVLVVGGLTLPPVRRLTNMHANPTPTQTVPEQVEVSPNSHLYHAGPSCPFVHAGAKTMPGAAAERQGLAPCPYCIGNSSARLRPSEGAGSSQ